MGLEGRIQPGRATEGAAEGATAATLKCRRRCWRCSCGFSPYGSTENVQAAGTVDGGGGKLPEKSELSWQGLGKFG